MADSPTPHKTRLPQPEADETQPAASEENGQARPVSGPRLRQRRAEKQFITGGALKLLLKAERRPDELAMILHNASQFTTHYPNPHFLGQITYWHLAAALYPHAANMFRSYVSSD